MEQYRTIFKNHYKIEFSGDFVIHHIDGNRQNNDISNLLLLPKSLHRRYHHYKRVIDNHKLNTTISGNQPNASNYYIRYYETFIDILNECNKWYDYKLYLDGKLPNIHGLGVQ